MNDTTVEIEETPVESARGRGRPATITLPVVEEVARLIAKGMTEEQACLRVGVVHASLRTAKHRNPEFETAIKRAQAEFLDKSLDIIGKGERGWQGRAWILERRHGSQFRRNTGMEVNAVFGQYSAADLLADKPIPQWSSADVQSSLGVWKLLRQWSPEQIAEVLARYKAEWGPVRNWTREQLEWGVELERRMVGENNENWPEELRQRGQGHEPGEDGESSLAG